MSRHKGQLVDLKLDEFRLSPKLQARVGGTNAGHVLDLAQVLLNGGKLPRIQVRQVDGVNYIVDGYHTYEAHIKANKKTAPANIIKGTWAEAVEDACGANVHANAPLKRTHADKQRAIKMILEVYPQWTDKRIADLVKVDRKTVAATRPQDNTGQKREAADGRKYSPKAKAAQVEEVEETVDVADIHTDSWGAVKLEAMEFAEFEMAAFRIAHLETADQLYTEIHKGCQFGFNPNMMDRIYDRLESLGGFDGKKRPRWTVGKKAGAELFDFRSFDYSYSKIAQGIDELARAYGQTNCSEHVACLRLKTEFRKVWDEWVKRLQKGT